MQWGRASPVGVSHRPGLLDPIPAQSQFTALLAAARGGVWIHRQGRVEYVNDILCRLLGYERPAQITGRPIYDFIAAEHHARVRLRIEILEYTGAPTSPAEYRLNHRDGSKVDVEVTGAPVSGPDGVCILAVFHPIGARKQLESDLGATRQRLRSTFDALAEGVIVEDVEGHILESNPAAERILGALQSRQGVLNDPFARAIHEDGTLFAANDLPARLTLRSASPTRDIVMGVRRGDGALIWISVNAVPLRDENGTLIGAVTSFSDITDRRLAEAALARSEATYRTLVHQASDGILMARSDGRYVEVNNAACSMLGYIRDDLLGKHISEIIEPEDLRKTPLACDYLRQGDTVIRERRFRRKDGSILQAEVSARALPGGNVLALVRDVGQRKRAEAALQAKEFAERANQAKTEFMSRISHELRTPLNAILGFSEVLQLDSLTPLATAQRQQVQHIHNAGDHLLQLINDLLDLSRIEAGAMALRMQDVELHELIERSLHDLHGEAAKNAVSIQVEHGVEAVPSVRADPTRLRQVLANLISNAIKYNRRGGKVLVRVGVLEDHVRLSVADEGPGMSESQLAGLFQPFNRLGREDTVIDGTGIGLVITRHLVELMEGTLSVLSEMGQGTEFSIELLRSVGSDPGAAPRVSARPASALQGRVLYIEDDEVNRVLVHAMLSLRPGIELASANDGANGVAMARCFRPDLILLDMQLPDMFGIDVLRLLRGDASLARIPCVAVSANAMPADVERALDVGFAAYLTKPLSVATLLAVMEPLLIASVAVHDPASTRSPERLDESQQQQQRPVRQWP